LLCWPQAAFSTVQDGAFATTSMFFRQFIDSVPMSSFAAGSILPLHAY
jgi:TolA-binding protein